MPTFPPPQCCEYGCKAPSVKGSRFCIEHAPAQAKPISRKREQNSEYKTAAWATIRMSQLTRAPLCACCSLDGRLTAADVVDHVFAWKSIGPHAFRANRFQSLCAPCHTRKTNLETKGVYRHYMGDTFTDYTLSDYAAVMRG